MAMNFPELMICSLPPMSFSDFCLLFVLLVLRKVFVVEILAIHSGTLLIFAVWSLPLQVLPAPKNPTTLQLSCSCIVPCEMWVCGYSLCHICYHGQSPHMWGIAYSPGKQDKIRTPERSWAGGWCWRRWWWVQERHLYDGTFLNSLHVNYCSLGNKNSQGSSFASGSWSYWEAVLRRLEGEARSWARGCIVYLNLFTDERMYDSHLSTS